MTAATAKIGANFNPTATPLVSRMEQVGNYRESLQRLQDVWDQLTLLGQMSGIAADITTTAEEFRALSATLLDSLAHALLKNTLQRMHAQAQVAIDILVRNLFERTADIGFLATDSAVRELLASADDQADPARAEALRTRFRAYVAKYSVYDDVLVLDATGRVRARLDDSVAIDRSAHALVAQALQPGTPFVESFGAIDLLGGRRGLLYSAAIRAPQGGKALGVLCLSFRFDDEMAGVFAHLTPVGACSVVAMCDAAGTVLASSDIWQLPIGAPLPPARDHRLLFAGREYLAVTVSATGYQGYAGPGWTVAMLVPIEQAFRADEPGRQAAAPSFPDGALADSSLVAEELRSIPKRAQRIQRGLERSVWNGEVRGRRQTDGGGFGAALLQQVTRTGERIKSVIESAIGDLQHSTAAAILDEARACAAFAVDIMDRNLYERANDCRWWALDGTLGRALDEPGLATRDAAARVLAEINGLYTVYATLLLLDREGRVVAASNDAGQRWVDQVPGADWVQPALQLRDGQTHVRSTFEASPLYDDRQTYVYAAGLQTGKTYGAVAIVFDGAPQFEAMLRDTLPKNAAGVAMPEAASLFVTRLGTTISSTDPAAYPIGGQPAFHAALRTLARGESRRWVLEHEGVAYAVGASMSRGYREYDSAGVPKDDDVACVVLIRIGAVGTGAADATASQRVSSQPAAGAQQQPDARQLASFYCDGQWLALDAAGVVEAIDVAQITALPGHAGSGAGVVMHGNEAVPVIDLRSLRHAAPRGRAEAPAPVILCRDHDRPTFGLRVDALGQVLDIAASSVKPLAGYLAAHDRHAEGVLSFQGVQGGSPMLTLLSLRSLANEVGAAAA